MIRKMCTYVWALFFILGMGSFVEGNSMTKHGLHSDLPETPFEELTDHDILYGLSQLGVEEGKNSLVLTERELKQSLKTYERENKKNFTQEDKRDSRSILTSITQHLPKVNMVWKKARIKKFLDLLGIKVVDSEELILSRIQRQLRSSSVRSQQQCSQICIDMGGVLVKGICQFNAITQIL